MIKSQLLEKIEGISHGFGTREDARAKNVVTVQQVHGAKIFHATKVTPKEPEGYDILIADRPKIAIAAKAADCLPVLIAEAEAGIVAAVHAGWKGTLVRVTEKAVECILEMGGETRNLVAALGPSMSGACFEVEEDVKKAFEREFLDWPILKQKSQQKWLLDVAETNRLQLMDLGLKPSQIDRIDLCTHCRPDLFWSYRRDGEKAGRMINFIEILK